MMFDSNPKLISPLCLNPLGKRSAIFSTNVTACTAKATTLPWRRLGLVWVERFPKQAGRGWDFVGLARLQSGQAATAETAFRNAVMLEEGDAELWDHLGTALNKQGKWSEAEAAFAKALALDSSSPHLLSNAAGNLSDNNKHEAAMQLLQRALEIKPDYHRAILNMGNALIGLGRMDEAIEAFREVTRLVPEWPAGWNNLGQCTQTARAIAGSRHCAATGVATEARFHRGIEQPRGDLQADQAARTGDGLFQEGYRTQPEFC